MTDGLSTLRDQITKLMSGVGSLITALQSLQNQFGGNTTLGQMGDADRLIGGMRSLGDTLQVTFGNMASNLEWVDPVVIALDGSPYCDSNPVCSTVRDQFRQLQTARNDGTLDKLAGQLQSTGALSNLSQTVSKLTQLMNSLTGSMGSLGLANPGGGGGTQSPLGNMQQGLDSLADGGRQVADGVQQLVDQTKRMGADLGVASEFLLAMENDAATPSMAGFYIPPQVLDSDDFKKYSCGPPGRRTRCDENPALVAFVDVAAMCEWPDAGRGGCWADADAAWCP